MTDFNALQATLGITFKEISLLEVALVHSSYINENPQFALSSNERLEFLGDAVLGMVVAEKLYQDFPDFSEGQMTKIRGVLVCQEALARMAQAFKLGDYLYMGKGEEKSGGRQKPANLAGAMEAVIAAIYLDQDFLVARNFILKSLDLEVQRALNQTRGVDYKSELQELTQARQQKTPTYHLIGTTGPDHDKRFTVEVKLGNTVLGEGSGKNKKEAESEAARLALSKLSTE